MLQGAGHANKDLQKDVMKISDNVHAKLASNIKIYVL